MFMQSQHELRVFQWCRGALETSRFRFQIRQMRTHLLWDMILYGVISTQYISDVTNITQLNPTRTRLPNDVCWFYKHQHPKLLLRFHLFSQSLVYYSNSEQALSMKRALYKFGIIIKIIITKLWTHLFFQLSFSFGSVVSPEIFGRLEWWLTHLNIVTTLLFN